MILRNVLRSSLLLVISIWSPCTVIGSNENTQLYTSNFSIQNNSSCCSKEEFQLRNVKKVDILPASRNYSKKIRLKPYSDVAQSSGIRILKKSNKFYKNTTNKHLLSKLGVRKVPFDSNDYLINNNKAESNLLIVKLPPNPYYYINLEPCNERNNKNCLNKSAKNLQFNFNINGKPNKIYHYNLPLISKAEKRSAQNRTRSSSASKVLAARSQTEGENDISMYQPLTNKYTVNSYYKGNGRFQSLYVINKKKKKKYQNNM